MSEQTNPTPDMETEENGAAGAVEVTQSRPVQPPVYVEDVVDVDDEEDEAYEEELDEEDEEESFRAPDQYVEREGSGRPRRIGSDVRYDEIDYKNISLLSRFLDRRGRILSRRKTRVSAKVQRKIVREIKRARHLALLPYTADQTRIVRRRK
jgi:small subunit ribosomal protein S18